MVSLCVCVCVLRLCVAVREASPCHARCVSGQTRVLQRVAAVPMAAEKSFAESAENSSRQRAVREPIQCPPLSIDCFLMITESMCVEKIHVLVAILTTQRQIIGLKLTVFEMVQ